MNEYILDNAYNNNSSMLSDLEQQPYDIWCIIANHITRRDMVSLLLTSRSLYNTIRHVPIPYESEPIHVNKNTIISDTWIDNIPISYNMNVERYIKNVKRLVVDNKTIDCKNISNVTHMTVCKSNILNINLCTKLTSLEISSSNINTRLPITITKLHIDRLYPVDTLENLTDLDIPYIINMSDIANLKLIKLSTKVPNITHTTIKYLTIKIHNSDINIINCPELIHATIKFHSSRKLTIKNCSKLQKVDTISNDTYIIDTDNTSILWNKTLQSCIGKEISAHTLHIDQCMMVGTRSKELFVNSSNNINIEEAEKLTLSSPISTDGYRITYTKTLNIHELTIYSTIVYVDYYDIIYLRQHLPKLKKLNIIHIHPMSDIEETEIIDNCIIKKLGCKLSTDACNIKWFVNFNKLEYNIT